MRINHVKGKEIVAIHQTRYWDMKHLRWDFHVDSIRLSDGTQLTFHVAWFDDGDHAVRVERHEADTTDASEE